MATSTAFFATEHFDLDTAYELAYDSHCQEDAL